MNDADMSPTPQTEKRCRGRVRKWPVLVLMVIVAVALVLWFFTREPSVPTDVAGAIIEVRGGGDPTTGAALVLSPDQMGRMVKAHGLMIKSWGVLRRVLDNTDIRRTKWWRKSKVDEKFDLDELLEALRNMVDVEPIPETNLILVSVGGVDGPETSTFATVVAQVYVEYAVSDFQQHVRTRMNRLEGLIAQAEHEQHTLRVKGAQLMDAYGGVANGSEGEVFRARIESLAEKLVQLTAARARAETELQVAQRQVASGELLKSPEVQQVVSRDPRLQAMYAAEAQLLFGRGPNRLRQARVSPDRPTAVERQLKKLRPKIAEREKLLQAQATARIMQEKKDAMASIAAQQVAVQMEYDKAMALVSKRQQGIVKRQELDSQIELVQARIGRFRQRLAELLLHAQTHRPVALVKRTEPRPWASR